MLEICHGTFQLGLSEIGVSWDRRLCRGQLSCLNAGVNVRGMGSGEGFWVLPVLASLAPRLSQPLSLPWFHGHNMQVEFLPRLPTLSSQAGKVKEHKDPKELSEHLNLGDKGKAVQNENVHDVGGGVSWGVPTSVLILEPQPERESVRGARMCSQRGLLLCPFLPLRGPTFHH